MEPFHSLSNVQETFTSPGSSVTAPIAPIRSLLAVGISKAREKSVDDDSLIVEEFSRDEPTNQKDSDPKSLGAGAEGAGDEEEEEGSPRS